MACAKKCAKKAAAPKAAAGEKLFEGYERREAKILAALKPYGITSILECKEICDKAGIDPYKIVEETQPICFENAKWAYTVGAAMAIKKGCTKAKDAAAEKLFEGYERREAKILAALKPYGIKSILECKEICDKAGIDPYKIVEETQPICFENAKWAYTVGAAMAIKKGCTKAKDAAAEIGVGLQAFCIPGSVAENRQVGRGHGNLGAMLLDDATECFAFLAGHESFAAAEGAIKIALNANKVRKTNLRVILNGLGKDAAYIISRINGFTYCKTAFNNKTEKVKVVEKKAFSKGPRAAVNCYGADNVPEGVEIMKLENVGVSITGNSTNPTRFQHPVAGTYKKWCVENGKKYFSVASGGGTGRTLHPDNMAAGPSSYGMTDTMGRMHSDAQFAGSSSVPAHVEMMGLIGMGHNPMVGATVAVAVAVEESFKK